MGAYCVSGTVHNVNKTATDLDFALWFGKQAHTQISQHIRNMLWESQTEGQRRDLAGVSPGHARDGFSKRPRCVWSHLYVPHSSHRRCTLWYLWTTFLYSVFLKWEESARFSCAKSFSYISKYADTYYVRQKYVRILRILFFWMVLSVYL